MSGETILDVTKAEMERVADAMSSIMAFMEADADGGRPEYQGKFQADIIEQSYAGLRNDMRESYGVIRDKWNEIIVNDLYQHDIRDCVDSFSAFHSRVEAFDDSFCRNLDFAVSIFNDEWIARKYLMMVVKTRERCRYLTDFVRNNFIERHFGADPFAGATRRFRNYFVGVSDDGLRRLVKEHITLPRRTRWLGDRREATIFGQVSDSGLTYGARWRCWGTVSVSPEICPQCEFRDSLPCPFLVPPKHRGAGAGKQRPVNRQV